MTPIKIDQSVIKVGNGWQYDTDPRASKPTHSPIPIN
jgi:hypothetical protein